MRNSSRVAFAAILVMASVVAVGSAATAGGLYEPPAPSSPPAHWAWAFTPRIWFAFETDSFFAEESVSQQTQEQYFYPFYGGTITATSPRGTAYSLTILHGEGDSDVRGASAVGVPLNGGVIFLPTEYFGTIKNERTDVEAIVQPKISEGVVATFGARYINFQRDEFDNRIVEVNTGLELGTARVALEQDFWLGELGFGVSRPVNTKGTIFLFGNLTGMAGYADVTEFKEAGTGIFNLLSADDLQGAVIGVDTNAGVAFKLGANMLLSTRYRLFYLSAPDVKFDVGGYFIHGPEANLTISF